jgi:hypothetical protein
VKTGPDPRVVHLVFYRGQLVSIAPEQRLENARGAAARARVRADIAWHHGQHVLGVLPTDLDHDDDAGEHVHSESPASVVRGPKDVRLRTMPAGAMLTASRLGGTMRSRLALIGSVLAVAGCSSQVKVLASNSIVVNVTCATGTGVVISVDPWVASAAANQPIVWSIASSADVDLLTIARSGGGAWPFQAKPPYAVTKQQPVSQMVRDPGWPKGKTAHYMISGSCKGMNFNIDPDMIVT